MKINCLINAFDYFNLFTIQFYLLFLGTHHKNLFQIFKLDLFLILTIYYDLLFLKNH